MKNILLFYSLFNRQSFIHKRILAKHPYFNGVAIANGVGTALNSTTNDIIVITHCSNSIEWNHNKKSSSQVNGLPKDRIINLEHIINY